MYHFDHFIKNALTETTKFTFHKLNVSYKNTLQDYEQNAELEICQLSTMAQNIQNRHIIAVEGGGGYVQRGPLLRYLGNFKILYELF